MSVDPFRRLRATTGIDRVLRSDTSDATPARRPLADATQATADRLDDQRLHALRLIRRGLRPREQELVDVLLTAEDAGTRACAGTALAEEGYLRAGRLLVIVVEPLGVPTRPTDDDLSLPQDAVMRIRRGVRPGGAIAATTRPGQTVLVTALDARGERDADPGEVARWVHGIVTARAADAASGRRVLVAYGNPTEERQSAMRSYREAKLAARVARAVPDLGPVAGWRELDGYQVLSLIGPDDLGQTDADRRVRALLDKPDLILTLETYLELAGDAKRTAERLHLHRASLYYRLNRIQDLLGVDLKRGDDRLSIHLALKTLRLRRMTR